jgi:hypothetical protein
MKLRHLPAFFCLAAFVFNVHAEIYKRVDDDGHVTYSSTPLKGAKKLHLEPLPTMAPPPKPQQKQNAEGFPRVNSETQSRRDDARRKILEDELATEQAALQEARAALKDGMENPEVHKGPDGQTFRNVAKYEEKVATLQEAVTAHEKNVEALTSELANLK